MNLESITIKGFRSYRTRQTFNFVDLAPGLYLVRGKNGSGKSSLFEATNWILFEQTSRGLKAGNIRSWETDAKCEGALIVDGVSVVREWPPRALQLDGTVVAQEELEKRLKLTPSIAQHLFHFSQFEDFFIDLKPSPRMDLYGKVLGLDFWDEKADKAGALAKKAQGRGQQQEIAVAKLESKIETLAEQDFSEEIDAWEKERTKHIKAWAQTLKEKQDLLAKLKKAAEDKGRLLKAQLAVTEAKVAKDAAFEAEMSKMNAQARLTAHVSGCKHSLELVGKEIERFEKLGTGTCGVCGQPITPQHKRKHTATLAGKLKEARQKLEDAKEAAAEGSQSLSRFTAAKRKAEAALDDAKSRLNQLTSIARERQKDIERAQEEVDAAEALLDKANAAVNPHLRQKKENEAALRTAKADLKKAKADLSEDREMIAALAFWQKGFKDIRLDIIQHSLVQLNAEVNESLHTFGLEGWEMRFEVEQENKSGGVRKGFLCTVIAPGAPADGVPWEAWSGGESQRLRLASELGIANLIAAFTGVQPNVEFWDEPSHWLEEQGMKALLGVLQERAERYQRAILLSEHKSLDFPFEGIIEVTKSEKGSKWQLVES